MTSTPADALARLLAIHHHHLYAKVLRGKQQEYRIGGVLLPIAGILLVVSLVKPSPGSPVNPTVLVASIVTLLIALYFFSQASSRRSLSRVTRVGTVWLKFDWIPYDSRSSLLIDRNNLWRPQHFKYPRLRSSAKLLEASEIWIEASRRLPELLRDDVKVTHTWQTADLPPTGSTVDLYDNEGALVAATLSMAEALADVIADEASFAAIPNDAAAVPVLLGKGGGSGGIQRVPLPEDAPGVRLVAQMSGTVTTSGLPEGSGDVAIEKWVGSLGPLLARRAGAIAAKRRAAVHQDLRGFVAEHTDLSHYSAFEFLCRICNREHLTALAGRRFVHGEDKGMAAPELNYSAVMRYLPSRQVWKCLLCRSEDRTPLPLPRLMVEIFLPAFQRLMQEHHVERLEMYNNIADQKRVYENDGAKELDARRESHRQEARTIRGRIGEFKSHQDAAKLRLTAFGSLLVQQKLLEEARLRDIEAASARIEEKIRTSFQEFEKRYDSRMTHIRDSAMKQMTHCADLSRQEEAAERALTQQMAANLGSIAQSSRESAIIQMAFAHAAGHDQSAWWNVPAKAKLAVDNVTSAMLGESLLDRFRREAGNG